MTAFAMIIARHGRPVGAEALRPLVRHWSDRFGEDVLPVDRPDLVLVTRTDPLLDDPPVTVSRGSATAVLVGSVHGGHRAAEKALSRMIDRAADWSRPLSGRWLAFHMEGGGKVQILRPLCGGMPIHWAVTPGATLVASEARDLLEHPDVTTDINWPILAERLASTNHTPIETVYTSIKAVAAGQVLRVDGATVTLTGWDAAPKPVDTLDNSDVEGLAAGILLLTRASVDRAAATGSCVENRRLAQRWARFVGDRRRCRHPTPGRDRPDAALPRVALRRKRLPGRRDRRTQPGLALGRSPVG